MQEIIEIKKYLDHITQDVEEARKILLTLENTKKQKSESAWKEWDELSKEVSKLWIGPDAVDEIKNQRDKK